MFKHAFTLFALFGIRVKIDPTWFVIAFLIVWSLSASVFPMQIPGLLRIDYLALGVGAAFLFFGSLILHEFAHAVVARRFGLEVDSITLFLFGGVAEMEAEPPTPGAEFWIAVAGPVASLVIASAFFGLQASLAGAGFDDPVVHVLGYLGFVNAALAAFNLIPGFPLDGGRILRAGLWRWIGDLVEATHIASRAGIVFGLGLVVLGIWMLLTRGAVWGLWPVVLGTFLVMAARAAADSLTVRTALSRLTVAEVTTRDVVAVQLVEDLETAAELMLRHHVTFLPVLEGRKLVGTIGIDTLQRVQRAAWEMTEVRDNFEPVGPENAVAPGLAVVDLFDAIRRTGRTKFVVHDRERMLGVVTLSDLTAYLAVVRGLGNDLTGHPYAERMEARRRQREAAAPSLLGLG